MVLNKELQYTHNFSRTKVLSKIQPSCPVWATWASGLIIHLIVTENHRNLYKVIFSALLLQNNTR